MNFLQKYSVFISVFLTLGIIGGGIYVIQGVKEKNKSLEKQIEEKLKEVREYEVSQEAAPTATLLAKLSREKVALEAEYQGLEERFKTYSKFVSGKDEKFPNLYFKEVLYITLDDIIERANKSGTTIPSSLDFSETGLPSDGEVPNLLLRLDMLEKMMNVVMKSKISTVNSITIGTPVPAGFYKEIPIDLTVTDTSFKVAKFLEAMGKSSSIFILNSIAITKKSKDLEAKLKIKGLVRERK